MKAIIFSILLSNLLFPIPVFAQHEHPMVDTAKTMVEEMPEMEMGSAIFPSAPMQRDGSGTSWLPDATPMHAFHRQYGKWELMFHENVFLRYTGQDIFESGQRENDKFDAPNWFMLMGKHPLGLKGQVMLRGMFSLDRITEGGDGYPLLFQSGETWEGKRLIDKQHPHDLFGELAVAYGHSLSENSAFFLYLGYPGEPALGPPVYLHRPSSQNNPDAPLGHHWQDATHICYGVATAGLQYEKFKFDGSIFTGREPDEKRLNFDKPRFDSYSFRVTMNPSEKTALQASWGSLKSPEVLEPEVNVQKATASLIYYHPLDKQKGWATTVLWGMNKPTSRNAQNSLLIESDLHLKSESFYARLEMINKTAEDLGLTEFHERLFLINALTLGATKSLMTKYGMVLSLGIQGAIYTFEDELESSYGNQPFSFEVFLRLSPGLLKMNNHKMNEM